jgi:hypothetical protein
MSFGLKIEKYEDDRTHGKREYTVRAVRQDDNGVILDEGPILPCSIVDSAVQNDPWNGDYIKWLKERIKPGLVKALEDDIATRDTLQPKQGDIL